MHPVADFNVLTCGIATLAATVGYAFTRKFVAAATNAAKTDIGGGSAPPLSSENKTPLSESVMPQIPANVLAGCNAASAKRKSPHGGFDEMRNVRASCDSLEGHLQQEGVGYPHNLANIYPNKKSRTPSLWMQPSEILPSIAPREEPPGSLKVVKDETDAVEPEAPSANNQSITIAPEPYDSPKFQRENDVIGTATIPRDTVHSPAHCNQLSADPLQSVSTAATAVDCTKESFSTPESESELGTDIKPVVPSFCSPTMLSGFEGSSKTKTHALPASRGFAAFAGSSSPLASISFKNAKNGSSKNVRPAWTVSDLNDSGIMAMQSSTELPCAIESIDPDSACEVKHVTGEEEEDVLLELKGVKLYVKCGARPFAEGMVGHVKLLSNRATYDQRIVYRREPTWKVSMNIRVHSDVRCSYDPEDNVLRIVHVKHSSGRHTPSSEQNVSEVVVYALKAGRTCAKPDFCQFAESLAENPRFRQASTSTDVVESVSKGRENALAHA